MLVLGAAMRDIEDRLMNVEEKEEHCEIVVVGWEVKFS